MHGGRNEHQSDVQGQEQAQNQERKKTGSQAVVGGGARIHRHQVSIGKGKLHTSNAQIRSGVTHRKW